VFEGPFSVESLATALRALTSAFPPYSLGKKPLAMPTLAFEIDPQGLALAGKKTPE
jgi:hypothetical protein